MSSCELVLSNAPIGHNKRQRFEKEHPLTKLPSTLLVLTYTFLPYQDRVNANCSNPNWYRIFNTLPRIVQKNLKSEIEAMFSVPGNHDDAKNRFLHLLPPLLNMEDFEELQLHFLAISIDCFIRNEPINRNSLILLQRTLNRGAEIGTLIQVAQTSDDWDPIIENCKKTIINKNFKEAFLIIKKITNTNTQRYLLPFIFHGILTQYKTSQYAEEDKELFIELFNQIPEKRYIRSRIISNVIAENEPLLAEALIDCLSDIQIDLLCDLLCDLFKCYLFMERADHAKRIALKMPGMFRSDALRAVEEMERAKELQV